MAKEIRQEQKFVAPDMNKALRMLADEFGADAILLSSRRIASGVEIIGLPPGAEVSDVDFNKLHSERRMGDRRVSDRRAASDDKNNRRAATELNPALNSDESVVSDTVIASETESLVSATAKNSAGALQQTRQAISESLAKLRTDYAMLLGDTDKDFNDTRPDAELNNDIRNTASALVDQFDMAANTTPDGQKDGNRPLQDMQRELKELRQLLNDSLLKRRDEQELLPRPEQYIVMNRLAQMGLSSSVVRALMASIETGSVKSTWSACLERLRQVLPVYENDLLASGGVYALVGPAGAGKTSMTAMLLARWILDGKADEVAVICCDSVRSQPVRRLAAMTDISVLNVDAEYSLSDRIDQAAKYRLVLIDTVSLSAEKPHTRKLLDEMRLHRVPIKEILVLPATGQKRYLERSLQEYNSEHCVAAALTFYEQAESLGELISLLLTEQLSAAYFARGVVLPDNLLLPDREQIMQQLTFAQDDQLVADIMMPTINQQVDSASSQTTV